MKSEICNDLMDREIPVGKQFLIGLSCFCMFPCSHNSIFCSGIFFSGICLYDKQHWQIEMECLLLEQRESLFTLQWNKDNVSLLDKASSGLLFSKTYVPPRPASLKLWQVNLIAYMRNKISDPSQFLPIPSHKDIIFHEFVYRVDVISIIS